VARLRSLCLAVIAVLFVGACVAGPSAFGASASKHARVHKATRCGRYARSVKRRRGHSARSVKRRGHSSCVKRHSKGVKHSTGTSKAGHKARSKSADYSSQGCANALLQPTEQNLESIRAATLCLINHERAAHGEAALRANPHLQQAAQGHTESMVVDNYFEHMGPQGETPLQRMRASGYIYNSQLGYAVGENIAWGTLWLGNPHAIVAAWMASPGHRANILDAQYRDTGIGVSPHPPRSLSGGQSGGVYTQDFGVIVGG
jgi:uncharacterized protein YkwD